MGLETIAIIGSIAVSVGTMAYALTAMPSSKSKQKKELNELQVTRAEEGQVVPLVYGTVRVPGSIIWYGNINYKETKAPGAKGGGASGGSEMYRVYCDVHLVLCEGKIELLGIYKDEEIYDYDASLTFNDGTNGLYVAYDDFAGPMPGIAHVYFKNWLLGTNVYAVPSMSFKVKRLLGDPLSIGVLPTNGENPAAIIWDLLQKTNASLDLSSFQTAATYWHNLDFGLNMAFGEQEELSKILEKINSQVPFVLIEDAGIYYLKAIAQEDGDDNLTPSYEVDQKDTEGFSFTRNAYNQVFSDFAANYTDADNTERTARNINEAVYEIVGERKNHSYELKGFNDLVAVKKRLSHIEKEESYPLSEVSFKTSLKYYERQAGDIIKIKYDLFSMGYKYFRITKISKNPFQNIVEITAREHLLPLGTFYLANVGTPHWQDLNMAPANLDIVKVVQLRYGKYREASAGKVPVLVCPVRKSGYEFSYDLHYSLDGVAYTYLGNYYSFAYAGELAEEYPANTYAIDDQHGILVSYSGAYALDDLTRSELFTTRRYCLVGSELMKFQSATTEGDNQRLMGILRDNRTLHSSGDAILIGELGDNAVEVPVHTQIYFKVCPRTRRGVLDLADATQISFTPNLKPDAPSRLKATRSGSTVTLEIWPNENRNAGYGIGSPDVVTDVVPHPFQFRGSFLLTVGSNPEITINTTSYTITDASGFVVAVKNQIDGQRSDELSLTVGAGDGEYIASL